MFMTECTAGRLAIIAFASSVEMPLHRRVRIVLGSYDPAGLTKTEQRLNGIEKPVACHALQDSPSLLTVRYTSCTSDQLRTLEALRQFMEEGIGPLGAVWHSQRDAIFLIRGAGLELSVSRRVLLEWYSDYVITSPFAIGWEAAGRESRKHHVLSFTRIHPVSRDDFMRALQPPSE